MNLSTIGVFGFLDGMDGAQTAQFARKVERLGYSALWFPEAFGRESFSHASYLLSNTEKLVLAAGIANVFMREPMTAMHAARTLAELFGDRFVLGLGVSNKGLNATRGLRWEKPLGYVREYIRKMKATTYSAPMPAADPPIVLGAVMPRMIELAATETRGTHTYFVPPEHTARARAAIGPDKWICAEQAVMLETNPAKARAAARAYMNFYLGMPGSGYRKNLLGFGFKEADFADGFSDRLVDAIVAWGSEHRLRERVEAHYKAGATHVCIQALRSDGAGPPDERVLKALAPSA